MPFIKIGYHYKRIIHTFGKTLLIASIGFSLVWFLVSPQTCSLPRGYALGDVDPGFSLTDDELITSLKKAEAIWEGALGVDVLEFDSKNGIPVNLIYDERQERTDEIKRVDDVLESITAQRGEIDEEYDSLSALYNELSAEYEASLGSYEIQVREYNETVGYWNTQHNVSKRIVESIKEEQTDLDKQRAALENQRIEINKVVARLNAISGSDKKLVQSYNSIVGGFQDVYGSAQLFDRAVYNGESINVYEFNDKDVLVLAFAHEMGHYLGIDHVEGADSVMYYLMQDQNVTSPTLSTSDINAFLQICDIEGNQWFGGWKKVSGYLQNIL